LRKFGLGSLKKKFRVTRRPRIGKRKEKYGGVEIQSVEWCEKKLFPATKRGPAILKRALVDVRRKKKIQVGELGSLNIGATGEIQKMPPKKE